MILYQKLFMDLLIYAVILLWIGVYFEGVNATCEKYYVDESVGTEGVGTFDDPFKTIQKCIDELLKVTIIKKGKGNISLSLILQYCKERKSLSIRI